jgi:scyllo-inositol 2-dehydrogenase (NADP+)
MTNTAICGYGYAGRTFHAYLVDRARGLDLTAIATRDPGRQRAAAQDYPGRTIYATVDELLADDSIDLVVFATPHDTHHDLAIQAMDAGKHVVVDKIMCMNAHEAQEMIEISERNGVLLSVFHNRRWDGDYLTVRKVIEDGTLGTPYLFEAGILSYRAPHGWRGVKAQSGGILYDWPAHFVDQALQLVPSKVSSVFCPIIYRDRWQTDIGNYAKLLIRFANDVLYQIEIGNLAAQGMPRWHVAGDQGALVKYGLDPQEGALRQGSIDTAVEDPANRARVRTAVNGELEELIVDTVPGSWTSYYQNIADVLNKGEELAVKPAEMLRLMRVYDAAMKSAETGQVVTLDI